MSRLRGRPRYADVLTPAEWRVVDGVRHGMTNRQIADRRGTSVDAVKFHVANALAKLGLPNRRALRHWDGIPVTSALATKEDTMTTTTDLKLGPIGQVVRPAKDINAAVAWYRDVLGLPHLYTFGELAFFDCGGTRLFLVAGEEGVDAEASVLYFRVDDIHAAHRELTARGVAFTDAPHLIHRHDSGMEEWMAFFTDLDGQLLALMAQVTPAPASESSPT